MSDKPIPFWLAVLLLLLVALLLSEAVRTRTCCDGPRWNPSEETR